MVAGLRMKGVDPFIGKEFQRSIIGIDDLAAFAPSRHDIAQCVEHVAVSGVAFLQVPDFIAERFVFGGKACNPRRQTVRLGLHPRLHQGNGGEPHAGQGENGSGDDLAGGFRHDPHHCRGAGKKTGGGDR